MIDERATASKFIMISAADCSIDLSSRPSRKWRAGCRNDRELKKKCTHAHAHINARAGEKRSICNSMGLSEVCKSDAIFMHICTFKFRFSQQCNKERLWTTRVCIMDKSLFIHTHSRIIRFCKLRTRTISELFRWFWKTVHRWENDK